MDERNPADFMHENHTPKVKGPKPKKICNQEKPPEVRTVKTKPRDS